MGEIYRETKEMIVRRGCSVVWRGDGNEGATARRVHAFVIVDTLSWIMAELFHPFTPAFTHSNLSLSPFATPSPLQQQQQRQPVSLPPSPSFLLFHPLSFLSSLDYSAELLLSFSSLLFHVPTMSLPPGLTIEQKKPALDRRMPRC